MRAASGSGHGLQHHRKRPPQRRPREHPASIGAQSAGIAPLGAKAPERIDRLRRQSDMGHEPGTPTLDQKKAMVSAMRVSRPRV